MKNENRKNTKEIISRKYRFMMFPEQKKKKSRVWRNNTDEEKVVGEVGKK